MTDQIPAGLTRDEARAVREWAERARAAKVQDETVAHAARVLLAVLPQRPTLADMGEEERAQHITGQVDVNTPTFAGRGILVGFDALSRVTLKNAHAMILTRDWQPIVVNPKDVTPRPDLPPLEWPGEPEAEDATPETEDATPDALAVGDVIESADDPRIPALPIGTILLDRDGEAVTKRREEWEGDGWIPIPYEGDVFGPWTVLHIPKKADQ